MWPECYTHNSLSSSPEDNYVWRCNSIPSIRLHGMTTFFRLCSTTIFLTEVCILYSIWMRQNMHRPVTTGHNEVHEVTKIYACRCRATKISIRSHVLLVLARNRSETPHKQETSAFTISREINTLIRVKLQTNRLRELLSDENQNKNPHSITKRELHLLPSSFDPPYGMQARFLSTTKQEYSVIHGSNIIGN
jgi:hypothetical protein